jgi:hypothetical protein
MQSLPSVPHMVQIVVSGLRFWCGVVWCGVAWCGVAWRGVVWCGVVWCKSPGESAVCVGEVDRTGKKAHLVVELPHTEGLQTSHTLGRKPCTGQRREEQKSGKGFACPTRHVAGCEPQIRWKSAHSQRFLRVSYLSGRLSRAQSLAFPRERGAGQCREPRSRSP